MKAPHDVPIELNAGTMQNESEERAYLEADAFAAQIKKPSRQARLGSSAAAN